MSKAYAEMKRVEPGSGLFRGPDPDSMLFTDRDALKSSAVEIAVLTVTLLWATVRLSATASVLSDLGWVWLFAMGCLLAVWRVITVIRSNSVRMRFLPDRLVFSSGDSEERTILYSEIRSVQILKGPADKWLEIVRKDGTNRSWSLSQVLEKRETTAVKLVQRLGPRLAPDVEFSRGVRPPEPLLAFVYDHFYKVPLVEMQPGLIYRYRLPSDMRHVLWNGPGGYSWAYGLFVMLVVAAKDAILGKDLIFWALFLCLAAVAFLVFLPRFIPRLQFASSLNDRFRRTPEGLEVSRRDQKWIVSLTHGSAAQRVQFLYGEPLRLTGENGTYYFDPRFIECDV